VSRVGTTVRRVRRTRSIFAATLTALALLAGCGDDGGSSSPSTTAGGASPSTKSADAIKAALLTPADVPGSTVSTSASSDDADFSACFPGNPLGGKAFPNEVEVPELELSDGAVQRQYSSGARQATEAQAREFVTTFGSESGSQCVLNAFKSFISNDPSPPQLDPSGLTAKVSDVPVADDGALLNISGNLTSGAQATPIAVDLLAFRKGGIVVLMSAGAVQGPLVPGQAVQLAQKIAGRLP